MEAALLIPSLFVVVALLVQPACLLYTRSVMSHAASEGARLAATASSAEGVEAFVRRRLGAVPSIGVFHEGGDEGWEVTVTGVGPGAGAGVSIKGRARPLPLTAAVAGALLGSDEGGVVLEASAEVSSHADWVKGSYGSWIGMWG